MLRQVIASLTLALGVYSPAIQSVVAQARVPIHELTAVEASSTDHFGSILSLLALADGGVLVDDGRLHQIVALDAALSTKKIIIDSVPTRDAPSYGSRPAPLVPFLGDSSFFVDVASQSLLLLSPTGSTVRAVSIPNQRDLQFLLASSSSGDKKGNLVYRAMAHRPGISPADQLRRPELLLPLDSLPIVRANFETRLVDTIGFVKGPVSQRASAINRSGTIELTVFTNPLSSPDEWAVLSNGTIAFVRSHDYHVEFVRADRSRFSSRKLPFNWKRLSDADKQALVDSAQAARDLEIARIKEAAIARNDPRLLAASGYADGPTLPGSTRPTRLDRWVPIGEINDYWPPIRSGSVKADLDSNLWVLPTTSAQLKRGELVYDVINFQGELTQRVRIPPGRSIAGFSHNGVVYLAFIDGDQGWRLERTRIVK